MRSAPIACSTWSPATSRRAAPSVSANPSNLCRASSSNCLPFLARSRSGSKRGTSAPTTSAKARCASALEAAGKKLVYAPGCAHVTEDLNARIANADVLFFDGTLFADDEMIANGLGDKTGRRMGHMPVSGPGGTLESLARHAQVRRILIHINNSNPILIEGSPEEAKVKAAGWEIAFDGMEVSP